MYTTVSIKQQDYEQIAALAQQMNSSKAVAVSYLIDSYKEHVEKKNLRERQVFNSFVSNLSKKIPIKKNASLSLAQSDELFEDKKVAKHIEV